MRNIEIHEDYVTLFVNPKIYTLDLVYSSAYIFLDRTYVMIDGDNEKIIVDLKPKIKCNLEELANEFFNEMLNYAVYKIHVKDNGKIREMIVQKALFTNLCDDCNVVK